MKSPFIQLWNVLTIPAFGFADRWIKNSVICVIVLAAAASVPARAANHAVLSSCANNGDGTSWSCASTNGGAGAFNAIPSTLARGDSYYFGVGNYTGVGPLTLSTADSGASLITWKATTAADYGGLSGFNSSTMVGQAVLPPLDVTSDYWNIDGVYSPNGDENTEPFFPAQCPIANQTVHSSTYKFITCSNSGYGFKIENWSGNDCSSGPCAPVATWAFDAAFLTSGNNITLQFTDVEGSMDQTSGTDGCDMALAINVGGTHSGGSNIHILYDYMHDQILGNYFDATQNTWVDHVYALRNTVCSSSHAELFGVRNTSSGTYNTVNWVLSNSIIGMGSSTAFWNTPNGGTGIDSIWIFGNIFYCNQGEFTSNSKCDAGDGFIMTEKESGGGFNPFVIVITISMAPALPRMVIAHRCRCSFHKAGSTRFPQPVCSRTTFSPTRQIRALQETWHSPVTPARQTHGWEPLLTRLGRARMRSGGNCRRQRTAQPLSPIQLLPLRLAS